MPTFALGCVFVNRLYSSSWAPEQSTPSRRLTPLSVSVPQFILTGQKKRAPWSRNVPGTQELKEDSTVVSPATRGKEHRTKAWTGNHCRIAMTPSEPPGDSTQTNTQPQQIPHPMLGPECLSFASSYYGKRKLWQSSVALGAFRRLENPGRGESTMLGA